MIDALDCRMLPLTGIDITTCDVFMRFLRPPTDQKVEH